MAMLGLSLARAGKRNEALEIRSKLRGIVSTNNTTLLDVAIVSFGLGDIADALNDMSRAENIGPFPYEFMGPLFDSLHRDPRFRSIASRRGIKLAP
jgi:hypothetical protein